MDSFSEFYTQEITQTVRFFKQQWRVLCKCSCIKYTIAVGERMESLILVCKCFLLFFRCFSIWIVYIVSKHLRITSTLHFNKNTTKISHFQSYASATVYASNLQHAGSVLMTSLITKMYHIKSAGSKVLSYIRNWIEQRIFSLYSLPEEPRKPAEKFDS